MCRHSKQVERFENDAQFICASLALSMDHTSRHWSDSLYVRIGKGSYGKPRNIKQWIYSLQMWFTSSTRPAIVTDSGQISAGIGTPLNYDKVRRRLPCPLLTNNASDTNNSVNHHCYVVTRPTRVPCALTTIFVMADRQGLRQTCTRLHINKQIVIDVYQQQSPRYLSIAIEACAMKANGNHL